MSDSSGRSEHCYFICVKSDDNPSTIAKTEDAMDITSLPKAFNRNVQPSDVICPGCGGSTKAREEISQECQDPAKKIKSSTSQDASQLLQRPVPADSPWTTVIVNRLPKLVDREKLITLFSRYGAVVDAYLCKVVYRPKPYKHERIAQITYRREADAWRVWGAFQRKSIKYEGRDLMITVVSDDYSPIENLTDDCLREIFLRLPSVSDKFNVEQVCRRWNTIGRQSWSCVTKVLQHWPSGVWETIASRAGHCLRDVQLALPNLDCGDQIDDLKDMIKSISSIAEHCVSLQKFMVSMEYHDFSFPPDDSFRRSSMSYLRSIVSKNVCLKRVSLWCVYSDEGLIDSFPVDIEEIYIADCSESELMAMRPVELSKFRNLQVFSLYDSRIDKDQLKGIETLENVRSLNFFDSEVHPSNIDKIVNFTKLEYLAIPNCQISDATLAKILRNNKGLKQLDISEINGITNSSLQYLSSLRYLEVLLMQNLSIEININFPRMRALRTLDCTGNSLVTDETIRRILAPNSMISKLYVADCSLTVEGYRIANRWVLRTGNPLTVYIDYETSEEWPDLEVSIETYEPPGNRGLAQPDWDDYNIVNYDCELFSLKIRFGCGEG